MNIGKQFKEGIITNNPVLVQLIGMCPTMATSTSLENGLGMGLAATSVLICSNFVVSILRKIIPQKIRIASYVVIISVFVTAVEMLLKAFLPDIADSLGLFIPLIVVNCIILARAEAFASKNKPIPAAIDGLAMGLGFTFALAILSSVREILGAGTIYGIPLFGENFQPATLMIMPAGGFLALGFVIAAFQKILKKGV